LNTHWSEYIRDRHNISSCLQCELHVYRIGVVCSKHGPKRLSGINRLKIEQSFSENIKNHQPCFTCCQISQMNLLIYALQKFNNWQITFMCTLLMYIRYNTDAYVSQRYTKTLYKDMHYTSIYIALTQCVIRYTYVDTYDWFGRKLLTLILSKQIQIQLNEHQTDVINWHIINIQTMTVLP
jgi:hypothetical protein